MVGLDNVRRNISHMRFLNVRRSFFENKRNFTKDIVKIFSINNKGIRNVLVAIKSSVIFHRKTYLG